MSDWILEAIARGGYLGIFLLMALENVIPPIPSEVIMGLGGIAVARGDMQAVPLVLWGTAGTTAGNCFWYWIGRRIGYRRLRPWIDRHGRWLTLDWADIERVQRLFVRHGGGVVFVFRFMPAFRTLVSLPAGMARMPLGRFLLWTFAGSLIWNSVLAGAGIHLGQRFHELERYVGPVSIAIFVAIGLAYVWRVVRR